MYILFLQKLTLVEKKTPLIFRLMCLDIQKRKFNNKKKLRGSEGPKTCKISLFFFTLGLGEQIFTFKML